MMPSSMVILTGIFAICASIIGSVIVVRNGNGKYSEQFKILVQTQIAKLETTISSDRGRVCNHHQESFDKVYKRIETNEKELSNSLVKFTEVAGKLDKSVAVLTERIDNQRNA